MGKSKSIYLKIVFMAIVIMLAMGTSSFAASLARVTGLRTTSVTTDSITLSWNKQNGAEGYEVFMNIPGIGEVKVRTTTSTSIKVTSLDPGTTYSARVRSYKTSRGNNKEYSEYSNTIRFITSKNETKIEKPGSVSGFKASTSGSSITFNWNTLRDVSGYEIELNLPSGRVYNYIVNTNSKYIPSMLERGNFSARIRAFKDVNKERVYGGYSNTIKFSIEENKLNKPDRVTGLTAKPDKNLGVTLSWDSSYRAHGYEVLLTIPGSTNNSYTTKTFTTSDTTQRITGLSNGVTYTVKVRSYNTVNGTKQYSDYSGPVSFIAQKEETKVNLDRVIGLRASTSGFSITMNWNKVKNADGYEIALNLPSGRTYNYIVDTNSKYIPAIGQYGGYSVKVRAFKEINKEKVYGGYSDLVKFSIEEKKLEKPEKVTGLKAKLDKDLGVTLSWDSSYRAHGYEVLLTIPGSTNNSYTTKTFTTSDTTQRITGLSNGVTYTVKVRAYNIVKGTKQYSDYSGPVRFIAQKEETKVNLNRVTGLRASTSGFSITMNWNKVKNADGYEIALNLPSGRTYNYIVDTNSKYIPAIGQYGGYSVKVRAFKEINKEKVYGGYSDLVKFSIEEKKLEKPEKVTGLKAKPDEELGVVLNWNKTARAEGYEIVLNIPGYGDCTYNVTETTRKFTGFKDGETYTVKVRAYNTVNGTRQYSDYSGPVSFIAQKEETKVNLDRVTGLRASTSGFSITMNWNKVKNADGYEIALNLPSGRTYNYIVDTNSKYIPAIGQYGGYSVKVRAFKEINKEKAYGEYSDLVKFSIEEKKLEKPEKVTGLTAKPDEELGVVLNWNKTARAEGYEIVLNIPGYGDCTYNVTETTRKFTGFKDGETYTVKVRAYNTVKGTKQYSDSYSDVVKFTTKKAHEVSTKLEAVTGLTASVKGTQVQLNWNKNEKAEGYELNIGLSNNKEIVLGPTVLNNITVIGFTEGETYTIKVRAYNTVNGTKQYSDYSNIATFTIPKRIIEQIDLGQVTGLKANIDKRRVNLSWDKNEKVEGYELAVYLPEKNKEIVLGPIKNNYTIISGFAEGKSYSVKVRGFITVNGEKEYSEYSKLVTFTIQKSQTVKVKPGKVTGLKSRVSGTSVELNWNKVENAEGYEIVLNIPGYGDCTYNLTETTRKFTGFRKGETYTVKVRAYNTVNGTKQYSDSYSDVISFTTEQ